MNSRPRWKIVLVALLLVSSMPRIGCICADGTHLPFCKKVFGLAFTRFSTIFKHESKKTVCACCAERRTPTADRGCDNKSPDPCDCEMTLEGPAWSATKVVEMPVSVEVTFPVFATFPLDTSRLTSLEVRSVANPAPPQCIAEGAVRLNV